MSVMRTFKPSFNRRALATQAMQAAADTRAKAKLDQTGPICIYGLCETLGVVVRFNNINMEGMYQRGRPPRIHLSARRPLPRRTYNCAHELGHHVFCHGSSIDELREDAKAPGMFWSGETLSRRQCQSKFGECQDFSHATATPGSPPFAKFHPHHGRNCPWPMF